MKIGIVGHMSARQLLVIEALEALGHEFEVVSEKTREVTIYIDEYVKVMHLADFKKERTYKTLREGLRDR